jgi:hypothetical protein
MKRTRAAFRWMGRHGGLIMFVITGAVYVLSAYLAVSIEPTRHEHVGFVVGLCQVAWRTKLDADPNVFGAPGVYFNSVSSHSWMSQFSGGEMKDHRYVYFPLWAPMIVFGAWAGAVLLWPRPRVPGSCRKCGYDCTTLPEGTRCPECGSMRRVRSKA